MEPPELREEAYVGNDGSQRGRVVESEVQKVDRRSGRYGTPKIKSANERGHPICTSLKSIIRLQNHVLRAYFLLWNNSQLFFLQNRVFMAVFIHNLDIDHF